jgi:integrase
MKIPPPRWTAGPGSTPRINLLFYNRITPRVRKQGQVPFDRLMNFLVYVRGKRAPLLPVSDLELLDWVTMSSDHVKYTTVQSWLSGVKREMVERRADIGAFETPWFKAGMGGLKKYKGETPPRRALALTLPLLLRLNRAIMNDARLSYYHKLTLAAAFSLGFACFLRCGEFTYDRFDPIYHIQRKDVDLSHPVPFLRLKYSKMDQTRKGRLLPIPRLGEGAYESVCPFTLLSRLFVAFPAPPNAPLFSFSRDQPVFSARQVIPQFRHSLAAAGIRDDTGGRVWSGHSVRRGAATWAADMGVTENGIMQLGRWSLGSVRGGHQRYIDLTLRQRYELVVGMYRSPRVSVPRRRDTIISRMGDDDVDDMWALHDDSP